MLHLHGTGQRKASGPPWVGLLAAGAVLAVTVTSIVKVGWLALAPFGLAALVLAVLLWLMRATDRAAR